MNAPAPPPRRRPDTVPVAPWRYLVRLARQQTLRVVIAFAAFSASSVAWIFIPTFISEIVDETVTTGTVPIDTAVWLTVTAIASSLLFLTGFWFVFQAETHVRRSTVMAVTDHLNAIGTGVRGSVSPGEMVNLSTEDTHRTGSFIFQLGFVWMSLVLFVTGSVQLWRISPVLGMVVIAGLLFIGTVAGPLLGRLQRRQSDYRAAVADLTSRAADVVGGLRVLRGIGGEPQFAERYRGESARLREAGYRVADADSWVQGLRISLPLALIAAVTWVGARMALDGRISVGQLAAVFGYATMMAVHAGFFIGMAQSFIAAHVAAKRLTAFFATTSDIDTSGTHRDMDGELHDPESGLTIAPGGLTVIVGADTGAIAAAFERLARYRDSQASWGGVPVAEADLEELRRRVLLLHDDYLFAQTLGETLRVDPEAALRAIATARADDVYTSLGADFDSRVDDSGRNLSGGQRQRLRLARALAVEPGTLLAVEPTSAVDAHTESLIAERLTTARAGRTTAIATASPLWLTHADQVAWMVDGKVRAVGAHAELAADPDYRSLTSRQEPTR